MRKTDSREGENSKRMRRDGDNLGRDGAVVAVYAGV